MPKQKKGPKKQVKVSAQTLKVARELKAMKKSGLYSFVQRLLSIDVCILLDLTSSMQNVIDEAVTKLVSSVDYMENHLRFRKYRISFVGYRDYGDSPQFVTMDFETKSQKIADFMKAQKAQGGGDYPEDIFGGMEKALELKWSSNFKMMLHMTDAPGHGKDFCVNLRDSHPGQGTLQRGQKIIDDMAQKGIFYFLASTPVYDGTSSFQYVDPYFQKLKSLATAEHQAKMFHVPMNDVEKLAEFISSSTSKVSLCASSSITTAQDPPPYSAADVKVDTKQRKPTSIRDMTARDAISKSNAVCFQFGESLPPKAKKTDVMEMVRRVELNQMVAADPENNGEHQFIYHQKPPVQLQFRNIPFAKGGVNQARYGFIVGEGYPADELKVVKTPLLDKKSMTALKSAKAYILTQVLSRGIMQLYNARLKKLMKKKYKKYKLSMCQSDIFVVSNKEVFVVETHLGEGKFVKYNSNDGWVSDIKSDANTSAQAFSHFSMDCTAGKLLVVDLQGIGNKLTDASIHSDMIFQLDGTDLMSEGFKLFEKTHTCNEICRGLGIDDDSDSDSD